jgi:serine/threonine-protein kinase RsbW
MIKPRLLFKQCYTSSNDVARIITQDINDFAVKQNLSYDVMNQIELCMAELVNNAYEHAYELVDGCPIEVACHLKENNELIIEVSDYGQSMSRKEFESAVNAEFVVPDPEIPETWTTSGRGFIIIVQLTDSLIYTCLGEKNIFKFHKKMWTK